MYITREKKALFQTNRRWLATRIAEYGNQFVTGIHKKRLTIIYEGLLTMYTNAQDAIHPRLLTIFFGLQ